jgi:hypothetical protein
LEPVSDITPFFDKELRNVDTSLSKATDFSHIYLLRHFRGYLLFHAGLFPAPDGWITEKQFKTIGNGLFGKRATQVLADYFDDTQRKLTINKKVYYSPLSADIVFSDVKALDALNIRMHGIVSVLNSFARLPDACSHIQRTISNRMSEFTFSSPATIPDDYVSRPDFIASGRELLGIRICNVLSEFLDSNKISFKHGSTVFYPPINLLHLSQNYEFWQFLDKKIHILSFLMPFIQNRDILNMFSARLITEGF